MSDVKVFYDRNSEPETFTVDKVVIKEGEYIIDLFHAGDGRVIIPKVKVHNIKIDSSVEVVRED